MSVPNSPRPAVDKTWLLKKFRHYHSQLGLWLGAFVILVSLTGIYLNHEDLFGRWLGLKRRLPASPAAPSALHTRMSASASPITLEGALAKAEAHWGEPRQLKRVELREEDGQLIYKVQADEHDELIVDARSGAVHAKRHYVRSGAGGVEWGKIIKDLHTGKLFGGVGKVTIDLTAGSMIALTLTGVYLWYRPKQLKRAKEQARQATAVRPRDALVTVGD